MLYYLEVKETIIERFELSGNKPDLASVTIQGYPQLHFPLYPFPNVVEYKKAGKKDGWSRQEPNTGIYTFNSSRMRELFQKEGKSYANISNPQNRASVNA